MKMSLTGYLSLFALVIITQVAYGAGPKVRQPWDKESSASESVVAICEDPVPTGQIAMDDFKFKEDGRLKSVTWWGTLLEGTVGVPAFYIAIYEDDRDCGPGELVYENCVEATIERVGEDCQGELVYEFFARLSPRFKFTGGKKYWLQISEDDERSLLPGVPEFRWSCRFPQKKCVALIMNANGDLRPHLEACTQQEADLSFILKAK